MNSSRSTSPGCIGDNLRLMISSSVIIRNLYVVGVPGIPTKAHPVLIVDPYRMLSLPIPRKLLQAITGRRQKVLKLASGVHHPQLPASDLARRGEALGTLPKEHTLGHPVPKPPDHDAYVSPLDTCIKG